MTPQAQDHSRHTVDQRAAPRATAPRWLLPGLTAAVVVAGLVLAGVVPLSAVLYIGLFGGMLLMHAGGHGGHGGGGSARDREDDMPPDSEDLSHRSHGAQPERSGSTAGLDDRATNDPKASETQDHDEHRSHGCH